MTWRHWRVKKAGIFWWKSWNLHEGTRARWVFCLYGFYLKDWQMSGMFRVVKIQKENLKFFWPAEQKTDLGDTDHEERGGLPGWREPERGRSKFTVQIPFKYLVDIVTFPRAEKTQFFTDWTKIELSLKRELAHWVHQVNWLCKPISILFWGIWQDPESLWHNLLNVWHTI